MNPNALKMRMVQPHAAEMVEWEELPSLAESLARRLVVHGARGGEPGTDFQPSSAFPPWDNTRPAALEPTFEPAPFRETTIGGLLTRELLEPDVFRHFFA